MKKNLLLGNPEPFEWWLNSVKLEPISNEVLNWIIEFNKRYNGDINNLADNIRPNDGDDKTYTELKYNLLESMPNCKLDAKSIDILFKKRATIHIQELFKKYVNEDTICVVSSHQHISAENCINQYKNVLTCDYESENSEIVYKPINEIIDKVKKYKNIFVYLIATEFVSGHFHNSNYYKELTDKIRETNNNAIIVLDAAQEMFLYPRDYSPYNYIIGTMHSLCSGFDQGILIINKELTNENDLVGLTGHKSCQILKLCTILLSIIKPKLDKIFIFKNVMLESIDFKFLQDFKIYDSCPNFLSLSQNEKYYLYNTECFNFIQNKFIDYAKKGDPYINVEISYKKIQRELSIRLRGQSMMFEQDKLLSKIDYFCEQYALLNKIKNIEV